MQRIKQACVAVGRSGWWAVTTCIDVRRQRIALRRQRYSQLRAAVSRVAA